MVLQPIVATHEDLIHDVAFDYYGRTLATCSSDRHIKVFRLNEVGKWILRDSWKAHDASIVKLAWAPPEFGEILASVSYDKTLRIWQHRNDAISNSGSCFKRLATKKDAQGPLFDVSFAPVTVDAFKVATIGSDSTLRIYDATNLSDLTEWNLIKTERLSDKKNLMTHMKNNTELNFTVNWCQSKYALEKLCASANDVAVLYININGEYRRDQELVSTGLIRDISWAPSMGRSYELLASASNDGCVRIYKIADRSLDEYGVSYGAGSNSSLRYQSKNKAISDDDDVQMAENKSSNVLVISLLNTLRDHKTDVWSVSWNNTGTILSSSGDDGKVRFWKASRPEEYRCIATTSVQGNS